MASHPLRIALAQLDCPVGAIRANTARIIAALVQARDQHRADIVVFPELAICGYPPDDLLLRPAFVAACAQALRDIVSASVGICVVVGWPQRHRGKLFNAVSVIENRHIVFTYRKQQLPNYGVFDERRYFSPGSPQQAQRVWLCRGVRIGFLICEDIWFDAPPRQWAHAGAELLLVINASPFSQNKLLQRQQILHRQAQANHLAIAYVNRVGGQDSLVFDGASMLSDANGHFLPCAVSCREQILVADLGGAPAQRSWQPVIWPCDGDESVCARMWRTLVLAVRDYCHKNGFANVWLGLSGGIDSAVILALAVDALGAQQVSCVCLPSRYTAAISNDLAQQQASRLGVDCLVLPINSVFQSFLGVLAQPFGALAPDVTEENLQSRCRGVVLMALANKRGGLVLTTGNKSEYAVGYATIYGDMCGGFAPLKDVYKTQVYALARWRNAQESTPVIPPAVLARAPTAELRDHQTDQDTLPPYAQLDAILERMIELRQPHHDIIAAGFAPATVDRVARLLHQSEWKRQQAALGPKMSACAFSRERRYPVTHVFDETDAVHS